MPDPLDSPSPSGFSEEEARRIFARAAERQHAARDQSAGLSMDELTEIGQAAGLDPAHVAAAAAEIRSGAALTRPSEQRFGIDLTPCAERVIPGAMTDEGWTRTVARLRRTFDAKGVAGEVGTMREWSSSESSNLHVTAEPVEGGTRVMLETRKGVDNVVGPLALGGSLAFLFLVLAAVSGNLGDLVLSGVVLLFLVGGGAFSLVGRRSLARWSATRQGQFEALLDQIELDARAALAEDAAVPMSAPSRVDPGLLEADDPALEATASRRRVRE